MNKHGWGYRRAWLYTQWVSVLFTCRLYKLGDNGRWWWSVLIPESFPIFVIFFKEQDQVSSSSTLLQIIVHRKATFL